jgi:hypothetical protein
MKVSSRLALVLLTVASVALGCGNDKSSSEEEEGVRVGRAGGTFNFPNGVGLDIPAGALGETVTISVKELSCTDVDRLFRPKAWPPTRNAAWEGSSRSRAG